MTDAQGPGGRVEAQESYASESVASRADLLDVVTEAMAEAWDEIVSLLGGPPNDPLPLCTTLARRILAAAGDGERDVQRLKRIALRAFES